MVNGSLLDFLMCLCLNSVSDSLVKIVNNFEGFTSFSCHSKSPLTQSHVHLIPKLLHLDLIMEKIITFTKYQVF